MAEMHLLLWDCPLFEDGDRLVLLGGAALSISGADPPGGFILRLPAGAAWRIAVDGRDVPRGENGDFPLPRGTRRAAVEFRTGG